MSESESKQDSNGIVRNIDGNVISERKEWKAKELSKVTDNKIWLLNKSLEEELSQDIPTLVIFD
jgi:hypothetical protein